MIAYASRTGTRRNLDALRRAGWRLLVSARGELRTEGFRYALDNGAWTSYQRGEPFDVPAFERAVVELGEGADWIVAPDIVAGGLESLDVSVRWVPMLLKTAPVLIAVQDGMEPRHVAPHIRTRVGLFVGGTSEWKERTLPQWGALGREHRCHVHVGRVNTSRRIFLAQDAGAHSFDGTSATRFACNLPKLDGARRQEGFRWSGK